VRLEFQEYFVASDPAAFRVLPNLDIPLSVYVGVAGMPGQTASYSWQVRLAFRP
jgi:NADPH-dependent curcumin reductase CurA